MMLVPEDIVIPQKPAPVNGAASTNGDVPAPVVADGSNKRKRDATEAELEMENVRKRGKVPEQSNGDDIIVLDDTEEGAILLD